MDRRRANVLVVEDVVAPQQSCHDILARAGLAAIRTDSRAFRSVDLTAYDVVLIDLDQTGAEGLALMGETKERQPGIEFIGITERQDLEEAKEAVRYGVSDFVAKPIVAATVKLLVTQALKRTEWTIRTTPAQSNDSLAPCWMEYVGDRQVTVGLERSFLKAIGQAIYIELPVEGQSIVRDGVLLKILAWDGRVYAPTSPVTGTVLRVNEALLWDADEIRQAGWAFRLGLCLKTRVTHR